MTRILMLVSMLASVAACGGGADTTEKTTPAPASGDFAGWDGWTRVNEARFVSKGHQQAWVDVYVEDAGVDIYRSKGAGYPAGTRLVKAQYESADAAAPTALTAMRKMPAGYDPDNGDWFYGVYDPSGSTAKMSGKVEMCINCHDQADATDWVFGPQ